MSNTLIEQVANVSNLNKAWRSVNSGKTDDARRALRGMDGISLEKFKKVALSSLQSISKDLLSGVYTMSPVKGFFYKKSNKREYRLICPPCVSDCVVHTAILQIIKPYFTQLLNTGASYSGVPAASKRSRVNHITALKNVHKAFKAQNYYVFESDIKGFFDSVDRGILLKTICGSLPDQSISHLIQQIIYFEIGNYDELQSQKKGKLPDKSSPIGLAQGSALSPFFANVYLAECDDLLSQVTCNRFFRYVDDFIIVGKTLDEVCELGSIAEFALNEVELELAENKTDVCNLNDPRQSFTFLGLKISRHEVMQKKKLSEVLSIIRTDYLNIKSYRKLVKMPFIEMVNSRVQGYANYYRSFHTLPMLNAINQEITTVKKKYAAFSRIKQVDVTGKKIFMSLKDWQSAFTK